MSSDRSAATNVVRSATRDDLAAINAIYNHYVLHATSTYQTEPDTLADREAWFEAHGDSHPVLVLEAEGQILGWASLSPFRPRAAYRFTVENSVYVHPEHHRKGIGATLLEALIGRARELGFRSIIAAISADQAPSRAIHESFGFEQVAHLKSVGFKGGRWLDVVYLQLELARPL